MSRVRHGLVAAVPIALVAGVYIAGRAGWLQMTHTGGAVLHPLAHEYGAWFLAARPPAA